MQAKIKNLGWCTDIHLNFLERDERLAFYQEIAKAKPDALMITGDIAESEDLIEKLTEMVTELDMPIYYVLGNHDFWHTSKDAICREMEEKLLSHNLWYLTSCAFHQLNDKTILLGVDGWADGRLGDFAGSHVSLWDSVYIEDLAGQGSKNKLLAKMQELADEDADWLGQQLEAAVLRKPEKIIIATHIPPFREASLYRGKISNDDFLPFYTCKATGDVLSKYAKENPDIKFDVYCGHTHDAAIYLDGPNLTVIAGAVKYREPKLQMVIDV